tara:strand:+ start:379 stop:522 length:144 start_codon:yes stop_codon:yes gene_type:complete
MLTMKEIAKIKLAMTKEQRKYYLVVDAKYNHKEWRKYYRDKLVKNDG